MSTLFPLLLRADGWTDSQGSRASVDMGVTQYLLDSTETTRRTALRGRWRRWKGAFLTAVTALAIALVATSHARWRTLARRERGDSTHSETLTQLQGDDAGGQTLIFSSYGPNRDSDVFALLFARYFHPRSRIVLLRQGAESTTPLDGLRHHRPDAMGPADFNIVFDHARVETVSVDDRLSSHQLTALRKLYAHSSRNAYEYELFCLSRHLITLDYMTRVNITSAFVTDLDIVPLTNYFDHFPRAPWTPAAYSSMFAHWDQRSLQVFADEMVRFYDRNISAVIQDLVAYGGPLDSTDRATLFSDESVSLMDAWPSGEQLREFTDMSFLMYFVDKFPHVITVGPGLTRSDWSIVNVHSVSADVCDGQAQFERSFRWVNTSVVPVVVNKWGERVPGLHLQGPECKLLACATLCSQLQEAHASLIPCCRQPQ